MGGHSKEKPRYDRKMVQLRQCYHTDVPLRMVRPSFMTAIAIHVMLLTVMRSSSSLRARCHTRMS